MFIRDIVTADMDAVLHLNESAVPNVNSIDLETMRWLATHADYCRVVETGTDIVAFLIGLGPGLDYRSPNYRWFCQRYGNFVYIDRVAVARAARRQGLASGLYADLQRTAAAAVPVMTCEVNLSPPNAASMRFHRRLGFEQVGSQFTEAGAKQVALLAKPL
jgi:predicted GNAT superfamily acetyltransferase